MTIIRQNTVTLRKGFIFKVLCIILSCSIIIYAIHFYRKTQSAQNRRAQFLSSFDDEGYRREVIMDAFMGGGHQSFQSSFQAVSAAKYEPEGSSIVSLEHKIVHFDLKGMPPHVQAFKEIFPFLKGIGVTGILLEYEDMFPFSGKLAPVRNKESYTEAEIEYILKLAKQENLEVIPLVQTFGHLEFLLKLEEFASLREAPRYPQVICPSNNTTLELIQEMIDQVLRLHPNVKYLHIGSDEVYYLGICPLCTSRLEQGLQPSDLFLQHVSHVARYVKTRHAVQPMMWDDEFRKLDEVQIRTYGIGDLVEIVVWNYHEDVQNALQPYLWDKYSRVFKSVWAGSAFKGANRPNSMIANETFYLTNHYSWMNVISDYQDKIKFKGIFLTGWQRYDHFSVLCEIFPVAIPSLVSCMMYLNLTGRPNKAYVLESAFNYLGCRPDIQFSQLCLFPGSQIYIQIIQWSRMMNNWVRIKDQAIVQGWMQDINFETQFTSPAHIDGALQEVNRLLSDVMALRPKLRSELETMFPQSSVDEWELQNCGPLLKEITSFHNKLQKIVTKTTFPVRPVVNSKFLPWSSPPSI